MRTDIELKSDAMKLLRRHFSLVESERFLTLMLRKPFDYTRWRQEHNVGFDVLPAVAVETVLRYPRNAERAKLFEEIKDWEYVEG